MVKISFFLLCKTCVVMYFGLWSFIHLTNMNGCLLRYRYCPMEMNQHFETLALHGGRWVGFLGTRYQGKESIAYQRHCQ